MSNNICIRVLADQNQIRECKEKISQSEGDLTEIARALNLAGNAVRLKILFLLYEEEQLCVCDLSDILEMNISAVSQHLRKLKDGNLIQSKKTGQTVFYSLDPDKMEVLSPLLKRFEKHENTEKLK